MIPDIEMLKNNSEHPKKSTLKDHKYLNNLKIQQSEKVRFKKKCIIL